MSGAVWDESTLAAWGERVGGETPPPAVLALRGALGAGKTTLARAVARGAGVRGEIPSPTFNLRLEYDSPRGLRLIHLDLFRLKRPEEVWELGWEELGGEGEVVLIEWPERAGELLPRPRWEVTLEDAGDPLLRRVGLGRVGDPPPLPAMVPAS
ncbi:MAG: tRNA (adenosine(37)-N6)-threonylcarbamoyltransferase complex ATPase subunit type 1 TsaE [Longimicrobiaceae bacterium]